MFFKDRRRAGEMLAERLEPYRGKDPLILAIPRGGVVIAEPVWERLSGDLDLITARKIGAPHQPELAVGAVTGDGFLMLNDRLVRQLGVAPAYIERAAGVEKAEIGRRLALYRGDRPDPEINGRTVLVIDDGVATGFTVKAALRSLRQHAPAELVLAIPVGPPETLAELRPEVDHLYCLESPALFSAVGQFYQDFGQVSDGEVIRIMDRAFRGL